MEVRDRLTFVVESTFNKLLVLRIGHIHTILICVKSDFVIKVNELFKAILFLTRILALKEVVPEFQWSFDFVGNKIKTRYHKLNILR